MIVRLRDSCSEAQWNSWRWQTAHALRSFRELQQWIKCPEVATTLPLSITPYYLQIIIEHAALRPCVIPHPAEAITCPGERRDPLGEEAHQPVEGIVHTYPDKALLLVNDCCPVYCRYCTRGRRVGRKPTAALRKRWEEALTYIKQHKEIRDVLLTGGDPLLIANPALDWLLTRLRAIKHVEFIRIGTKVPAVLPMRIDDELCHILRKDRPTWLSLHVTHPAECTEEMATACNRLADAGIPLGSQTVLLKNINDEAKILKDLFLRLLQMRVRPYYLFQCDPIQGSERFRVPIAKGQDIIRQLHGHTTGYAIPTYMIDAPGGGGKVPLTPDYTTGREGDDLLLKNYQGKIYRYKDGATT